MKSSKDSTLLHDWLRWAMDHIEGQVNFGDTKAGLLLTADSILLAGLLAVGTSDQVSLELLSELTVTLLATCLFALVAALLLALATILPNRKNLLHPDVQGRGMTNFSAIASLQLNAFLDHLSRSSLASLDEDAATSVHGKAAWARRKFLLLYAAIAMTQFAVVLATLAALSEAILA